VAVRAGWCGSVPSAIQGRESGGWMATQWAQCSWRFAAGGTCRTRDSVTAHCISSRFRPVAPADAALCIGRSLRVHMCEPARRLAAMRRSCTSPVHRCAAGSVPPPLLTVPPSHRRTVAPPPLTAGLARWKKTRPTAPCALSSLLPRWRWPVPRRHGPRRLTRAPRCVRASAASPGRQIGRWRAAGCCDWAHAWRDGALGGGRARGGGQYPAPLRPSRPRRRTSSPRCR